MMPKESKIAKLLGATAIDVALAAEPSSSSSFGQFGMQSNDGPPQLPMPTIFNASRLLSPSPRSTLTREEEVGWTAHKDDSEPVPSNGHLIGQSSSPYPSTIVPQEWFLDKSRVASQQHEVNRVDQSSSSLHVNLESDKMSYKRPGSRSSKKGHPSFDHLSNAHDKLVRSREYNVSSEYGGRQGPEWLYAGQNGIGSSNEQQYLSREQRTLSPEHAYYPPSNLTSPASASSLASFSHLLSSPKSDRSSARLLQKHSSVSTTHSSVRSSKTSSLIREDPFLSSRRPSLASQAASPTDYAHLERVSHPMTGPQVMRKPTFWKFPSSRGDVMGCALLHEPLIQIETRAKRGLMRRREAVNRCTAITSNARQSQGHLSSKLANLTGSATIGRANFHFDDTASENAFVFLHCFKGPLDEAKEEDRLSVNSCSYVAVAETTNEETGYGLRVSGLPASSGTVKSRAEEQKQIDWILHFDSKNRMLEWQNTLRALIAALLEADQDFRNGYQSKKSDVSFSGSSCVTPLSSSWSPNLPVSDSDLSQEDYAKFESEQMESLASLRGRSGMTSSEQIAAVMRDELDLLRGSGHNGSKMSTRTLTKSSTRAIDAKSPTSERRARWIALSKEQEDDDINDIDEALSICSAVEAEREYVSSSSGRMASDSQFRFKSGQRNRSESLLRSASLLHLENSSVRSHRLSRRLNDALPPPRQPAPIIALPPAPVCVKPRLRTAASFESTFQYVTSTSSSESAKDERGLSCSGGGEEQLLDASLRSNRTCPSSRTCPKESQEPIHAHTRLRTRSLAGKVGITPRPESETRTYGASANDSFLDSYLSSSSEDEMDSSCRNKNVDPSLSDRHTSCTSFSNHFSLHGRSTDGSFCRVDSPVDPHEKDDSAKLAGSPCRATKVSVLHRDSLVDEDSQHSFPMPPSFVVDRSCVADENVTSRMNAPRSKFSTAYDAGAFLHTARELGNRHRLLQHQQQQQHQQQHQQTSPYSGVPKIDSRSRVSSRTIVDRTNIPLGTAL